MFLAEEGTKATAAELAPQELSTDSGLTPSGNAYLEGTSPAVSGALDAAAGLLDVPGQESIDHLLADKQ